MPDGLISRDGFWWYLQGFVVVVFFTERFQKGFSGLIPVVLLIMKMRCIVGIFRAAACSGLYEYFLHSAFSMITSGIVVAGHHGQAQADLAEAKLPILLQRKGTMPELVSS